MELERIARRGVNEEDEKWFSNEAVLKLKTAQEEVYWLLNRGYKISSAAEFVGSHYQLSARQRTALKRATSSRYECERRRASLLDYSAVEEGPVYIDGFNLIITLEVALSGGVIIIGNDDAVRDLAGLRGTYRIIDKTRKALELIGHVFDELKAPRLRFYLDAPVSNSGRLREAILKHSEGWNFTTEVELVPNADPILINMDRVVTSDSIILDGCKSWFNISRKIIEDYIKDANIVNLNK